MQAATWSGCIPGLQTMAQIENVTGAITVLGEGACHLGPDRRRRGVQHTGIQIAL